MLQIFKIYQGVGYNFHISVKIHSISCPIEPIIEVLCNTYTHLYEKFMFILHFTVCVQLS